MSGSTDDVGDPAPPPPPPAPSPAWVHPTAVVEAGARLGPGTKVWRFCHVRAGARVGADCMLGQNVYVGGAVEVGNGCRIQNNVSLYDGVVLEDDVFVGPSVVFTNVKRPRAFRPLWRFDPPVFAATRVGRGTTIGANATLVCGVTLGAFSFVGAGAVVTRDVPAHALVVGAPARRTGWVCRCGGDLEAAVARPADWTCIACGDRYRMNEGDTLGPA
jgi:UDP-2-acetamido-3-amino-2,3-dideoxy-glucuronate N-acetyltransferase